MVYTDYIKQQIIYYHTLGHRAPTIETLLQEEKLKASRVGIDKFLKHYREMARKPGSGRPSKLTTEMKLIVEEQMRKDNETSTYQLHQLLVSKGYEISLLRCRTALGWTFDPWISLLPDDTRG